MRRGQQEIVKVYRLEDPKADEAAIAWMHSRPFEFEGEKKRIMHLYYVTDRDGEHGVVLGLEPWREHLQ